MHTRPQLYQVLEYCIKYKFFPIITSKLLEFDKTVADLIIKSKGIVHISLGRDEDEVGPVALGSTNRWRLAQALRYKRYGCPTQVRVVADVTMPMSVFHKKAYFLGGGSTFILLTPLHYTNRAHFNSMRNDITWDEAKTTGLFVYERGDLRPTRFHADWLITKERCGVVAGKEYCNNCRIKVEFNKKDYKKQLIDLGWSE